MEKKCANCKHGGDMAATMYGWRHCHLTIAQVPVGNDFHTHRDDCPCPNWAEKPQEPPEYRPDDGPFYACNYLGITWEVRLDLGGGRHRVIAHCNIAESAKEEVDHLNTAVRQWAYQKPSCVNCAKFGRCGYVLPAPKSERTVCVNWVKN